VNVIPTPLRYAPLAGILAALLSGCTVKVATEPIEVKPIYIRVDVEVRADRAIEQYLADLNRRRAELEAQTAPAPAPANPIPTP
jgi:hypothetical protein